MNNQPLLRLLITSGDGPAECRLAVRLVIQRLRREAEAMDLHCEFTVSEHKEDDHPSSALVLPKGDQASSLGKRWTGTIKWSAQSPIRPHRKRRNWFVGVFALEAVMGDVSRVDIDDVRFKAFRAGGPGGQHQNKTESAVRAVHMPTGLAVVAHDQRSQHRNMELALRRLVEKLLLHHSMRQAQDQFHENQLHKKLERGNPVRCFKGGKFVEV